MRLKHNTSYKEWFFSRPDKTDTCWNWKGRTVKDGYCLVKRHGKNTGAHRMAYELEFGKFDKSLYVLHKCDNRRCVNPSHLFVGTQKQNMMDCAAKGRLFVQRRKRENAGL